MFQSSKRKTTKGTVLVVNGFSVYGHKDERTLKIAKALAQAGFRSVAVAFEDLNRLHIHPRIIDEMADVIVAISKNKSLCASGKIGVFAPSYSAGMMLNAAAKMPAGKHISSLCAIGTYGSIEPSLNFVINSNNIDDYGRNVLLYNFLPYTNLATEGVLNIIKTAIEDNGFKRAEPLLPKVLSQAEGRDAELWKRFENDIPFRKKTLEEAFENVPNKDAWVSAFNVLPKVVAIETPVVFIHGKNDLVIPASESETLHQEFLKHGKNSFLCVTGILDHGDVQKNLSVAFEASRMVKAFHRFLKFSTE